MKKTILKIIAMGSHNLSMIIIFVFIISGRNYNCFENEQIIGKWKILQVADINNKEANFTSNSSSNNYLIFCKDGQFTENTIYRTLDGNWELNCDIIKIELKSSNGIGAKFKIIESNDTLMILRASDNDVVIEYILTRSSGSETENEE